MRAMALVIATIALAACSKESGDTAGANGASNGTAPAPAAQQSPDAPSFDCARADGQAQELVCSDKELAAMDREAARLNRLADRDSGIDPSIGALRDASLRAWIKSRDDCWKDDELRRCVVDAYARHIADIRSSSKAAREAAGGVVIGPVAFQCEGISRTLNATFINTEPGVVHLQWIGPGRPPAEDAEVTLPRAPAASGARYQGAASGGEWTFWNKGREVTLTIPGKGDVKCAERAN